MADTDSDQLHEVSDAELESMISSKNDDESDLNSFINLIPFFCSELFGLTLTS